MDAELSPQTLKVFSKIVTALSRLNEYIKLEFWENKLNLSVISDSLSSFALVSFNLHFFESYKRTESNNLKLPICIKIHSKALLGALQIRPCHIKSLMKWQMKLDVTSNVFHLSLYIFPEMKKLHALFYEVASAVHAKYPTLSEYPLAWIAQPGLLSDWLQPLERTLIRSDESNWWYKLDHSLILSSPNYNEHARSLSIRLDIDTSDMKILKMDHEIQIAYSISELKALIHLAEALDLSISGYIGVPGNPIVLQVVDDFFTVRFILSSAAVSETGDSSVMEESRGNIEKASFSNPSLSDTSHQLTNKAFIKESVSFVKKPETSRNFNSDLRHSMNTISSSLIEDSITKLEPSQDFDSEQDIPPTPPSKVPITYPLARYI